MDPTLHLLEPRVEIRRGATGDIVLQNRVPLAPYPRNLAGWLHQHAVNIPDKPFLQQRGWSGAGTNTEGGKWAGVTYREALALVNRLSNGLVALGMEAQTPVAILAENSIEMALFQFAAMQVGLPVVPISVAYSLRSQTGDQIRHILDVTRPQLLLTSNAALHLPKVDTSRIEQVVALSHFEQQTGVLPFAQLLTLAGEESVLGSEAQARFDAVTHDTVAKIQFTSGSTGQPKGVMVTHGMMTSNQVAVAQLWPFLGRDGRMLDWLPWNHTAGGNGIFNMAYMHGWSYFIDDGNPTPAGQEKTLRNIIDVRPTVYFGVPRTYNMLYARMQQDEALRQAFFQDMEFIFVAAAALDQATYAGMKAMSVSVRGEAVPFFTGWGCTESAPHATLVYSLLDDIRVIGVPIPGTTIKLAAHPSGRQELRIKGPNVTPGYYNNAEATQAAFDDEGFYCSGDAGMLKDPACPAQGLIFAGRIGENFKLSSGVWVQNGSLRDSINALGQPCLLDIVVTAPDRPYLGALIFPNVAPLRARFAEAAAAHPDDETFLQSDAVRGFFRSIFQKHNATQSGSSRRFERALILTEPPGVDTNETTDKGYINQQAVLARRADLVENLYQSTTDTTVIAL